MSDEAESKIETKKIAVCNRTGDVLIPLDTLDDWRKRGRLAGNILNMKSLEGFTREASALRTERDAIKAEFERMTKERDEAFDRIQELAHANRGFENAAASACVLPELSEGEIEQLVLAAPKSGITGYTYKEFVVAILDALRTILASRPASEALDVPADVLEKCAEAAKGKAS
jgi:hypothetical protein